MWILGTAHSPIRNLTFTSCLQSKWILVWASKMMLSSDSSILSPKGWPCLLCLDQALHWAPSGISHSLSTLVTHWGPQSFSTPHPSPMKYSTFPTYAPLASSEFPPRSMFLLGICYILNVQHDCALRMAPIMPRKILLTSFPATCKHPNLKTSSKVHSLWSFLWGLLLLHSLGPMSTCSRWGSCFLCGNYPWAESFSHIKP